MQTAFAQDVTRWPRRADLINTLQRISGYTERTDGRGGKERKEKTDGQTQQ